MLAACRRMRSAVCRRWVKVPINARIAWQTIEIAKYWLRAGHDLAPSHNREGTCSRPVARTIGHACGAPVEPICGRSAQQGDPRGCQSSWCCGMFAGKRRAERASETTYLHIFTFAILHRFVIIILRDVGGQSVLFCRHREGGGHATRRH